MRRLKTAVELILIFSWDFVWAVLNVGSWVFRSNNLLKPAIVRMHTKLENPKGLWILSLIIFLTPGSLIVEALDEERVLYIHFFHSEDPDESLEHIRQRFESRLKILFDRGGRS